MSRLVTAILILFVVLLGLRFLSSPFFQQNFLNRLGETPPTQTTGFNTTVPTDISQNTPLQPNRPQPGQPDGSGGQTKPTKPSRPLRPIPGGW